MYTHSGLVNESIPKNVDSNFKGTLYQQNMSKSAEQKISTKHVKMKQRTNNFKSFSLLHKIIKIHRLEPNTLNNYQDVNLGTMYILQTEIKTKGLFCFTI